MDWFFSSPKTEKRNTSNDDNKNKEKSPPSVERGGTVRSLYKKELEDTQYIGDWVDGLRHGVGKCEYDDGSRYEGQWERGLRHGFGTQIYSTGEKYQGKWVHDVQEGSGNITWPGKMGDIYEGVLVEGERVKGTYNFNNRQSVYVGSWKEDIPFEAGMIELPEGNYTGTLFSTRLLYPPSTYYRYSILPHGQGQLEYKNGNRYFGQWANGKREGYGVFVHVEESRERNYRYYGNWKKDEFCGMGCLMYEDGTFYEGFFSHNAQHGMGKLCFPNGDMMSGEWANGRMVDGAFVRGKYHDTPRPLKKLIEYEMSRPMKSEEIQLYCSPYKWLGYLQQLVVSLQKDCNELDLLHVFKAEEESWLTTGIEHFCDVFTWNYGKYEKSHSRSNLRVILAHAIDDVCGFVEGVIVVVINQLSWKVRSHLCRKLRRILSGVLTSKLYSTILTLYAIVHREEEALLRSKCQQLAHITPSDVGIDRQYWLEKSGEQTDADKIREGSQALAGRPPHRDRSVTGKSSLLQRMVERRRGRSVGQKEQKKEGEREEESNGEKIEDGDEQSEDGSWVGWGHTRKRDYSLPSDVARVAANRTLNLGKYLGLSNKKEDLMKVENPLLESEEEEEIEEKKALKKLELESSHVLDGKPLYNPATGDSYYPVTLYLQQVVEAKTPSKKLKALLNASHAILACVDRYYEEHESSGRNFYLGAEDKFPILIFATIKANASLWLEYHFLSDLVNSDLADLEATYRIEELKSVLRYICGLSLKLRDENSLLIPMNLLERRSKWALRQALSVVPEDSKIPVTNLFLGILRKLGERKEGELFPEAEQILHNTDNSDKIDTNIEQPAPLSSKTTTTSTTTSDNKYVPRTNIRNTCYAPLPLWKYITSSESRLVEKHSIFFEVMLDKLGLRIEGTRDVNHRYRHSSFTQSSLRTAPLTVQTHHTLIPHTSPTSSSTTSDSSTEKSSTTSSATSSSSASSSNFSSSNFSGYSSPPNLYEVHFSVHYPLTVYTTLSEVLSQFSLEKSHVATSLSGSSMYL